MKWFVEFVIVGVHVENFLHGTVIVKVLFELSNRSQNQSQIWRWRLQRPWGKFRMCLKHTLEQNIRMCNFDWRIKKVLTWQPTKNGCPCSSTISIRSPSTSSPTNFNPLAAISLVYSGLHSYLMSFSASYKLGVIYLWRWRSDTSVFFPYILYIIEFSFSLKTVVRWPHRIVPPMTP